MLPFLCTGGKCTSGITSTDFIWAKYHRTGHTDISETVETKRELHVCICVALWSTAAPGEPSHVVGLLLGGFNESQKLQLRHGANEASADAEAEGKKPILSGAHFGFHLLISHFVPVVRPLLFNQD